MSSRRQAAVGSAGSGQSSRDQTRHRRAVRLVVTYRSLQSVDHKSGRSSVMYASKHLAISTAFFGLHRAVAL